MLRGDKAKHESVFTPEGDGYHHAIELQEQINNFNKGIFVDGSEMKVTASPFSYGVEMNTWDSVGHQFLALCHAPFDTDPFGFSIVFAF